MMGGMEETSTVFQRGKSLPPQQQARGGHQQSRTSLQRSNSLISRMASFKRGQFQQTHNQLKYGYSSWLIFVYTYNYSNVFPEINFGFLFPRSVSSDVSETETMMMSSSTTAATLSSILEPASPTQNQVWLLMQFLKSIGSLN